jgi:hypothetical protein
MSIVAKVFSKRKVKSEPVKSYNNPIEDGLYRICMNCETMFRIDDDLSRAAFCWTCYLKVLRSGHYLGPHMTHPEWKYYPEEPVIKTVSVEEKKPKQKKCACGQKFYPVSNRQVHCSECSKTNRKALVAKAVRKYNSKKKDRVQT